jgi:O-methyltransferase
MLNVDKLIDDNISICNMFYMNNPLEIKGVLRKLQEVLNNNIEGDVVELGCHNGGTSIWIQTLLQLNNSNKKFHVYDSWEGIPDKHEKDYTINYKDSICPQFVGDKLRSVSEMININNNVWIKGTTKTQKENFINSFTVLNVQLPIVHSGFFNEINDSEYPDKISFAYFDGDFYSSIIDSFNKVYHKMVPGGIIVIDDCGDYTLIGVKNACMDFLKDKPEKLHLDAYPNIKGEWIRTNFEEAFFGGWIQKI